MINTVLRTHISIYNIERGIADQPKKSASWLAQLVLGTWSTVALVHFFIFRLLVNTVFSTPSRRRRKACRLPHHECSYAAPFAAVGCKTLCDLWVCFPPGERKAVSLACLFVCLYVFSQQQCLWWFVTRFCVPIAAVVFSLSWFSFKKMRYILCAGRHQVRLLEDETSGWGARFGVYWPILYSSRNMAWK